MIIQYKNPPSSKELTEKMKKTLANMGYDTPEKRKQWYESYKPIAILCTRIREIKKW